MNTILEDRELMRDKSRLHCCQCGADLGSAEDPFRDPDCAACLRADYEAEKAKGAA